MTVDVVANDDPQAFLDRSSLAIVGGPSGGTATLAGNGRIQYTADATFSGRDTVRYRVCTYEGSCGTATLVVDVG